MWPQLIDPYLKQIEGGRLVTTGKMGKLFKCPSAVEEEEGGFAFERSYGMNQEMGGWFSANGAGARVVTVSKAKYPSQTMRMAETQWRAQGGSYLCADPRTYDPNDAQSHQFAIRHNDVGEVLWVDGHVSSMTMGRYVYQGDPNSAAERANNDKRVWLRITGPKYQP